MENSLVLCVVACVSKIKTMMCPSVCPSVCLSVPIPNYLVCDRDHRCKNMPACKERETHDSAKYGGMNSCKTQLLDWQLDNPPRYGDMNSCKTQLLDWQLDNPPRYGDMNSCKTQLLDWQLDNPKSSTTSVKLMGCHSCRQKPGVTLLCV